MARAARECTLEADSAEEALVRGRAALRAIHADVQQRVSLVITLTRAETDVHAALAGALGLELCHVWQCTLSGEARLVMRQPASTGALARVRSSCCLLDTAFVSVDLRACVRLSAQLLRRAAAAPGDDPSSAPYHTGFFAGLSFASLEDEVSAFCALDLLNFGSGYKRELRASQLGRYRHGEYGSAFVVMSEGVERAAREAPWSALRMVSWRASDTERHFRLPEHPEPPESAQGAALAELAALVNAAIRGAGRALVQGGHTSLGGFVLEHLGREASHGVRPSASSLIDALVALLPALADVADIPATAAGAVPASRAAGARAGAGAPPLRVHLLKKAQLLVASLHAQLSRRDPRFDFSDLHLLTVAADPVLPAVLRTRGCLVYAPELAACVDGQQPLPPGGVEEVAIRAGAVAACEAILAVSRAAGGALDASSLDLLLWGVLGKSVQYRAAPRHIARQTFWH